MSQTDENIKQTKEKITYTKKQIDSISEKLKKMPDITIEKTLSKRDVVKILTKEIIDLKKRGYTIEQIAETLKGEGFDIATPTLKNYLRTKKRKQKEQTLQNNSDIQKPHTDKNTHTVSNSKNKTDTKKESKATFMPKPDTENI